MVMYCDNNKPIIPVAMNLNDDHKDAMAEHMPGLRVTHVPLYIDAPHQNLTPREVQKPDSGGITLFSDQKLDNSTAVHDCVPKLVH